MPSSMFFSVGIVRDIVPPVILTVTDVHTKDANIKYGQIERHTGRNK